jgi:hypothetical protein
MFYEIKLKVDKDNGKGEMKEVVEHFITDVGLFAEAEANRLMQEHMRQGLNDMRLDGIVKTKIIDLI